MRKILINKYLSEEELKKGNVLNIDFPLTNEIISYDKDLSFSGWYISKEGYDNLFIKENDIYRKVQINRVRKDAKKAIAPDLASVSDVCGFSIDASINDKLEFYYLNSDGTYNILCTFKKTDVGELDYNIDEVKDVLDYKNFDNIDLLKETFSFKVDEEEFKRLFVALNNKKKSTTDDIDSQILINRVTNYFNSNSFVDDFIERRVKVTDNHYFNNINIIRIDIEATVVVLFQHVTTCDAVYFPEHNVLKILHHLNEEQIFNSLADSVWTIISGARKLKNLSDLEISLLVSHGRPYHYLYNNIPLLNDLIERKSISNSILQVVGQDFLDLKIIFKDINYKLVNYDSISKCQSLIFKIGREFYKVEGTQLIDKLDQRIRENIGFHKKDENKDNSISIWMGITVQKRSWLEQVEYQIELLSLLSPLFEEINLYLDGWTAPHNKSAVDYREINNDLVIFERFKELVPDNVKLINLIGETMEEKIRQSGYIDFFIANQLTGSMLISRIARKPGITHISRAGQLESSLCHINPLAIPVPVDLIEDVVFDNDRTDYVSYTMDKNGFLALAQRLVSIIRR
ncbi:hypothetical protein [Bizionia sp.]|uniref:hypothetical protein n=1 Tax=Bizionia sp. TaxID=1954480 RepID=UPI003A91F9BB